jgi:large subunit ribosomal protein L21e
VEIMVKNSKGTLSGNTRRLKGKMDITVSSQVRTFDIGAKVVIVQKSTTDGQPHMRYNGRHGKIIRKQGKCYVVQITDGGLTKELISNSIHLKAV